MEKLKVWMKMNFNEELKKRVDYANSVLAKYLPEENGFSKELAKAMNYSVNVGGKRLRPIFIHSFYSFFGGDGKLIEPCMVAMEMLHTYSLVHDDLPALDNDELRRGLPTTHKKYGEAAAILAGDGLLHQSYEAFIKIFDFEISDRSVKALKIFVEKTGINGMLGGQAADVFNTGREISDELMYYIYEHKTGALIEGSMMIGACLAGCSDEELSQVNRIGTLVGLAFQIKDDILDIIGDEKSLGKPLHSDDRNNKKTYVTINGIEKSINDIINFSNEANTILNCIGHNDNEREFIIKLINYLIDRNK